MWLRSGVKTIILSILLLGASGCRQDYAEDKVRDNLREFKQDALSCLDKEKTNRAEVEAFFSNSPSIPYWRYLEYAKENTGKISQEAKNFHSSDKVRHCFVGYRLAQNTDHRTGVFAGFYKEAQDLGDCNRSTRFEISDQVATIIGARYASKGRPISDCRQVTQVLDRNVAGFLARRDNLDVRWHKLKRQQR